MQFTTYPRLFPNTFKSFCDAIDQEVIGYVPIKTGGGPTTHKGSVQILDLINSYYWRYVPERLCSAVTYSQLMTELLKGQTFFLSSGPMRHFRDLLKVDERWVFRMNIRKVRGGANVKPEWLLAQDSVKAMRQEIDDALLGYCYKDVDGRLQSDDGQPPEIDSPGPDVLRVPGSDGDSERCLVLTYREYQVRYRRGERFGFNEVVWHRFKAIELLDEYCLTLEKQPALDASNDVEVTLDLGDECVEGIALSE